MNVDGSFGPAGSGSDNGSDNDVGSPTDTGIDVSDIDFSSSEESKTSQAVNDVVDKVADTIEDLAGVSISDQQRAEIADKISKEITEKGVDGTRSAIVEVLEAAGIPGAKEIAAAIADTFSDGDVSAAELAKNLARNLAQYGLDIATTHPVAKAVVGAIVEHFSNPEEYSMADLMGDIAGTAVTVAAGLVGSPLAALAAAPLAEKVDQLVTDHVQQAIAEGDVVYPGEEGFEVAHGAGHDKGEDPLRLLGGQRSGLSSVA